MPTVYTVGHSTRSIEDFLAILQAYGITCLVDIRTVPRSRRNPQFNKEALPDSLQPVGIEYLHLPELGGLRKTSPDSINQGWKNDSFRGYADYMQTPGFEAGLDRLIAIAAEKQVAIMCAEAVPWRCHRSLVGDALVVREISVVDILDQQHSQPHKMTPFAVVQGKQITYPAPSP